MAAVDIPSLLGISEPKKPNKNMALVLLLRHLADLLDEPKEDDEMKDEREQDQREVPVRPRVEPLGGS